MVVMQCSLDMNINSVQDHRPDTVTFVQAIKDKYVFQDKLENVVIPKDRIISTDITFVGFEKISDIQRQLKRLTSLDLSCMKISEAGHTSELEGSLNGIQLINLAGNQINWTEVANILKCMPNIREVILSSNPLGQKPPSQGEPKFIHLKSIVLGRIYIDWATLIDILSHMWVSIDSIDLWSNELNESAMVALSDQRHQSFVKSIRSLRFRENYFTNFDWITRLGQLQSLSELDLSSCKIELINMNQDLVKRLSSLTTLNISYNNITSWQSITNLNQLKNLVNLICLGNPFYSSDKHAKYLVIGRLGTIKSLNREEITRTIRRDAELLYFRRTFPEYKAFVEGRLPNFKSAHPRYDELIELYGLPEDLNRKQTDEKYVVVDLCYNGQKLTKKLPSDMRVCSVQMLCKRLFKMKPTSSLRVTCQDALPSGSSISYELDQDVQTLHFFSVKSGQQLLIEKLSN